MPSTTIYQEIKPTFLYIKQHTKTGILYFGKTTRDPYKYKGSGTHWKRHIKQHGREFVKTLWASPAFTDAKLISAVALSFSEEVGIVESPKWANKVPENGLDGGSNTKGMMTMREKSTGKCLVMSVDDPRRWSGDFEGPNKGNKNPGNNKGKVSAKFVDTGITTQVPVDDPGLKDGTLVGVAKGTGKKLEEPRSATHSRNISVAKTENYLKTIGIESFEEFEKMVIETHSTIRSIRGISRSLGVSSSAVKKCLQRHGIVTPHQTKLSSKLFAE